MRTTRSLLVLACAASLTFGAAACSSGDAADQAAQAPGGSGAAQAPAEAAWPRTIDVAGEQVTVDEKPSRIAVLSPGAAALAAEIVPADRLAAITDFGPETPEGPQVIGGSAEVDPEQVMAMNPDLVLVTSRHGQEKDAGAMLADAGLPVAVFPGDSWGTIDDMLAHAETIGKLTGDEDAATALVRRMKDARAQVDEAVEANGGEAPRVLALMARGGRQLVTPPSMLINGLIREAGGVPVAEEAGGHGAVAADPEKIAELAPDVILVEDFRGRGEEDFAGLLSNPALADVPAVKDGRISYLAPQAIGVSAGPRVTDGLKAVAEAIGTLRG